MFRRFYLLTLLVRFARKYKESARHNKIVKKYVHKHYKTDDWCRSELRARDLYSRAEKASSWFPLKIYPSGGAAGPLLLYLLIRILEEMPVRKILELGAGQSTQIFDAWAQESRGLVVTFEHDKSWADSVSLKINHEFTKVLHLPLVEIETNRGVVQWYSNPPNIIQHCISGFDLVLVDGPIGQKKLSRYGVVEKLLNMVGDEWILMWDDLDRSSDLESYALFLKYLNENKILHDHVLFDGDRTVGIVYTPKYSSVRYFW
jgi:hypothetical protein